MLVVSGARDGQVERLVRTLVASSLPGWFSCAGCRSDGTAVHEGKEDGEQSKILQRTLFENVAEAGVFQQVPAAQQDLNEAADCQASERRPF